MIKNYYVLLELYSNGFKEENLIILSLISIFCGILVIVSKNPIISVLFLISLFLSISLYLMFIGYNFIGISYLLVYIGAVSILFLFILMLINVRVSELLSETSNSLPLSIIIAFSFSPIISQIIPFSIYNNITTFNFKQGLKLNENDVIMHISYESWDNKLIENYYISSIGNVLYTNFSIWLILTSIILLLAMIGCIVLTIKQK